MNNQDNPMKVEPLIGESFLAMVQNSIGSKAYRTYWAKVDGKKKDIVENGRLACAFFVSSLLHAFLLIKEPHLTVVGLERELQSSDWQRGSLDDLHPGDVLIWIEQNGHRHVGFYIGEDQAVSTNSETGLVSQHDKTFSDTRSIENAYFLERIR